MEKRDLPGNDASWYRALLGDQEPASPAAEAPTEEAVATSEPEEAVATSEPEESDADDVVVTPPQWSDDVEPVVPSEDAAPDEGDSAVDTPTTVVAVPSDDGIDGPVETTSEVIGQLWTAQETSTPFDDWEPGDVDRKVTSRRPFRWTSVLAAVTVVALIVVGLVLLPSIARNRADNHRDMMTSALGELRSELPDTQSSLRTATEPDATVSALNDLSTQLTVLTAKASAVDDAGRADLPAAPPFTSSAPIDDLAPIQQRLEPLATTAQTIQRRISNLVQYRSLMNGFMVLPDLPTEADPAAQADLRVVLASAQAESASILTDLPNDVSLSGHQELARSINEFFAGWQIDYLEALRTQDPLAAETLVADLMTRLEELDAELITPLAQIRRQTDADLIDLARSIDEVVALANGDSPAP